MNYLMLHEITKKSKQKKTKSKKLLTTNNLALKF